MGLSYGFPCLSSVLGQLEQTSSPQSDFLKTARIIYSLAAALLQDIGHNLSVFLTRCTAVLNPPKVESLTLKDSLLFNEGKKITPPITPPPSPTIEESTEMQGIFDGIRDSLKLELASQLSLSLNSPLPEGNPDEQLEQFLETIKQCQQSTEWCNVIFTISHDWGEQEIRSLSLFFKEAKFARLVLNSPYLPWSPRVADILCSDALKVLFFKQLQGDIDLALLKKEDLCCVIGPTQLKRIFFLTETGGSAIILFKQQHPNTTIGVLMPGPASQGTLWLSDA